MNMPHKTIFWFFLFILFSSTTHALESHPAILNSAPIWDTLDQELKIGAVENAIEILRGQGIIIRKEPEFYVDEIDRVRTENLEMRIQKVGVILKTVAILHQDYDNGEDPNELVSQVLSEEAYGSYIKNNEKKVYEILYQVWKTAKVSKRGIGCFAKK